MTKEQYIKEAHEAGKTVYVYVRKADGVEILATLPRYTIFYAMLVEKIPPPQKQ